MNFAIKDDDKNEEPGDVSQSDQKWRENDQ